MVKKKTKEDYYNLVKDRNIEWIGKDLPERVNIKTKWKCEICNYILFNSYNRIHQGKGCPNCAGNLKKNIIDYHKLAKENNIEWIDIELPKHIKIRTNWKCKICNYIWPTCYSSIQQGSGCLNCSKRNPKTIKDYHKLAELRNFKWIGKELPIRTTIKTDWFCRKCKHEWPAKYNSIQQRRGCPNCSDRRPKTIEDYHNLVKDRNIKWIGNELPKRVDIKTNWECIKKHTFSSDYSDIKQGNGCPYCINFKEEDRVRHIFEKLTNHKFIKSRPKWLINPKTGYRLELDGYCEELNLAFEYDGEFHYKDHHNRGGLEYQQYRDGVKTQLCLQNNITLIRIPYFEQNKEQYIKNQLILLKII